MRISCCSKFFLRQSHRKTCISRCRKKTRLYQFSVSHQSNCRLQGNHLASRTHAAFEPLTSRSSSEVQWELNYFLESQPVLWLHSWWKKVKGKCTASLSVNVDDVPGKLMMLLVVVSYIRLSLVVYYPF